MKRTAVIVGLLIGISFPSWGESLSTYYLRMVSGQGMAETLEKIVYVFCGLGSLVSLVLVFTKMADQDHEASQRAQQWCLSLVLIAAATFTISLLLQDARSVSQINVNAAISATTTQLSSSFGAFSNMVYAACGMVALFVLPGKVRAMQEGDRYAGKGVVNWCLALVSVISLTYLTHIAFF